MLLFLSQGKNAVVAQSCACHPCAGLLCRGSCCLHDRSIKLQLVSNGRGPQNSATSRLATLEKSCYSCLATAQAPQHQARNSVCIEHELPLSKIDPWALQEFKGISCCFFVRSLCHAMSSSFYQFLNVSQHVSTDLRLQENLDDRLAQSGLQIRISRQGFHLWEFL